MSKFELKLPKMGESVAEATITAWLKEVGDTIELDEAIVEIATDKVDSEVPSEVEGVLLERFFEVDDVVGVGQVIAVIETNGVDVAEEQQAKPLEIKDVTSDTKTTASVKEISRQVDSVVADLTSSSGKFYSPLVKNIAKTEGLSQADAEAKAKALAAEKAVNEARIEAAKPVVEEVAEEATEEVEAAAETIDEAQEKATE